MNTQLAFHTAIAQIEELHRDAHRRRAIGRPVARPWLRVAQVPVPVARGHRIARRLRAA
jgi:hypothetical protein